jgi:hypothetical protein
MILIRLVPRTPVTGCAVARRMAIRESSGVASFVKNLSADRRKNEAMVTKMSTQNMSSLNVEINFVDKRCSPQ